jgi:HNH endonuclease
MRRKPIEERFWEKVQKTDGCWLWTAHKDKQGYGRFGIAGTPNLAHRISYLWAIGPVPAGYELDHLCRVTSCVRPSHLEAVTRQEHNLRGENLVTANLRKTHCPRGHEYDMPKQGGRWCRTCQKQTQRDRYWKNVEATRAKQREQYWKNPEHTRATHNAQQRRKRAERKLAALEAGK